MRPDFSADPESDAIYRFLRNESQAASGSPPSPATMPRRSTAQRTPADIARAEGLNLGLDQQPARTARPRRSCPRPAQPTRNVFVAAFNLALTTLPACTRRDASTLAQSWVRSGCLDPEQFLTWAESLGLRNAHLVRQLIAHGITPDLLETRIDGTRARIRLRNGESVGGIVAALLQA
ncbi:hypothetical protein ABZ721_24060 [Streptomyces sp. NPDC006733]|uniref:hypothetical protein n=1 Tax=Streptomyces sp. NPDC006733 TaxID=3155460 RepID=UPI0033CAF5C7